jgi:hypothetical protein
MSKHIELCYYCRSPLSERASDEVRKLEEESGKAYIKGVCSNCLEKQYVEDLKYENKRNHKKHQKERK